MNRLFCISGVVLFVLTVSVSAQPKRTITATPKVIVGAENTTAYLPLIKGKKVALVVNQTSKIGRRHLVDSLIKLGVSIPRIFAPEHGFRGKEDAGADINNTIDKTTGIPIISLYGKKLKPNVEDLKGIEIVLFDIQDVGCRFYTFLSTLHYLLEACSENRIPLIVLDRPNPNGYYVDGPILDKNFKSFVGISPIPVVYGLTLGEYATMARGEAWIEDTSYLYLSVIKCQNYTHKTRYTLPIAPSPNLRTSRAIFLYPSLCFFEGTDVSVGRGTAHPFEMIGSPSIGLDTGYTFTPISTAGATDPPQKGKLCKGYNLTHYIKELQTEKIGLNLHYLLAMYSLTRDKEHFFSNPSFFDKLAGSDHLRLAIVAGKSIDEIKQDWQPNLNKYKSLRKKYLLYPDF